jgi:hypothetical protein
VVLHQNTLGPLGVNIGLCHLLKGAKERHRGAHVNFGGTSGDMEELSFCYGSSM